MNDQPRSAETEAAAAGVEPSPPKRHRFLLGTLFALATIIGVFAVLAVWVNRQALNTDNWTKTSSSVLADQKVQAALSTYLVNQLFSSVDVQGDLKGTLPTQVQSLAGPLAGGLQAFASQVTPRLLASPQAQQAWRQANRAAHEQLMKIINGGGNAVSTQGGVVTLNTHALVSQLAATLGIQQQVAAAQQKLQGSAGTAAQKLGVTLPSSTGQLVIMRSKQLQTAQDIAGAIKGLAILLPLLTFALFILAVWLARGRRRLALRTTGWCVFGIGLITLLARRVIGNQIVDDLVKNASNKPAVHDVWNIATSLLYGIGAAMLVYGLIVVIAAWIAGSTRPATALRRAMAPSLRERPVLVYALAATAYLIVVVWGPTPAFRQAIPLIGIAVVLVLGIEALRRSTAREFPEAQGGGVMATPAPVGPNGGQVADLERLATLHDRGALTDAEFQSQKAALIHNRG